MERKALNVRAAGETRPQQAKASGRKTRPVEAAAGLRKAVSTGVLSGTTVPAGDLKRGSRGTAVKQLQGALVKLGHMTQAQMDTGPGTFGSKTEAALKKFQKAHGVPSTGNYGPMTRMAFVSLGAKAVGAPLPSGKPRPAPRVGFFPPPRGFAAIKATFGQAGEHMVTARLPLGKGGKLVNVRLHEKMKPLMKACLEDARKKGLLKHINTFDGMYPGYVRNKRSAKTGRELQPPRPSVHSWGIAFDINARPAPGRVHPALVQHFKEWRFTWGGDFRSNLDPMHFQYASGY
jgi:hypothetical protein